MIETNDVRAWRRAVELGGLGWYARARADAAALRRSPDAVVRSMAASLDASLVRQGGDHRRAAVLDGRAAAEVGLRTASPAAVDALVGLAADALGVGRLSTSTALLTRAAALLARCEPAGESPRAGVRYRWVRAEVAMASGDGAAAERWALSASAAADALDSPRHRVKSAVVRTAAALVTGRDGVRGDARRVRREAEDGGFLPLAWAAAAIGDAAGDPLAAAERARLAAVLRARGGPFD
ncbi:hypothetical protein [Rhodococcoides corynebacterioides]|uniref:Uncharacterized protein n=1 Tax=Rhodococcoides corynebacterioides TaxID=53972 RepID=A0ABS7P032_9NOCA|nr:hypothetical protein [Rhodococcus corynebacterioides]MBY6365745.1 hypothetical protein [Rhodococcus corynebacterioides]MBY6406476.1 hypothetical protein [Rhodococcus corynebacterioides]